MCEAIYYKHTACSCRWAEVAEQCLPGMGFSTCPDFDGLGGSGVAHEDPVYIHTAMRSCPAHGLGGIYDRNYCRMVVRVRNGVKVGLGPGKEDMGVECPCLVM